jgi:two-component system, OmpR family, response regulator TrcR
MPNVLIVEDDGPVARLLDLAFSVEGYATEVVTSGERARDRLRGPAPDIVVLDVVLPEVDGLTLLRQLRGSRGWQDTKVVLLTARDSDDDVWQGWAAGTDYYLTKPFELPQLRAIAERLLAGEDLSEEVAASGAASTTA